LRISPNRKFFSSEKYVSRVLSFSLSLSFFLFEVSIGDLKDGGVNPGGNASVEREREREKEREREREREREKERERGGRGREGGRESEVSALRACKRTEIRNISRRGTEQRCTLTLTTWLSFLKR